MMIGARMRRGGHWGAAPAGGGPNTGSEDAGNLGGPGAAAISPSSWA